MPEAPGSDDRSFSRRLLLAAGLLVLVALLFWTFQVAGRGVLVLVAGIVIAVLIDGVARLLPVPRPAALVIIGLVTLGALVGISWWMGSALLQEMQGVRERVQQGWPSVQAWLEQRAWGRQTLEELAQFKWSEQAGGRFGDVLVAATGGIATAVLVPVFGVFFAVSPGLYLGAMMHLVPQERRPRLRHVVHEIGRALRSWFVGRFVSMAVVGIGTGVGLWIAGVPMALGLGLIAGLLSFVPNVGPLIAAVPGMLVALSVSPSTVLWALLVYVVVQLIDNYVVTPLVDMTAVNVPPAAQLGTQLLLGLAVGAIGVFLATPLVIIVVVMVQAFYVQDVLHDPVRLLSQHQRRGSRGWLRRLFRRRRREPAPAAG